MDATVRDAADGGSSIGLVPPSSMEQLKGNLQALFDNSPQERLGSLQALSQPRTYTGFCSTLTGGSPVTIPTNALSQALGFKFGGVAKNEVVSEKAKLRIFYSGAALVSLAVAVFGIHSLVAWNLLGKSLIGLEGATIASLGGIGLLIEVGLGWLADRK